MELPPSKLARLNLPEDVQREIDNTRRITAHIARKRQLAFLAKVMRRHGEDAFADARAALGENRERQRQETAAMHRLEATRERLLNDEGDSALGELIAQHPSVDRQHLRSLIRQARTERDGNWSGLDAVRLCTEQLFPVCSPKLMSGRNRISKPADLLKAPLLHLDDSKAWSQWFDAAGIGLPTLRGQRRNG